MRSMAQILPVFMRGKFLRKFSPKLTHGDTIDVPVDCVVPVQVSYVIGTLPN